MNQFETSDLIILAKIIYSLYYNVIVELLLHTYLRFSIAK